MWFFKLCRFLVAVMNCLLWPAALFPCFVMLIVPFQKTSTLNPWKAIGHYKWEGGLRSPCNPCMKLKGNFLGGGGAKQKTFHSGSMDTFWKCTLSSRRLRLSRKAMDCTGDVSSLRSSIGCDCRAQFWTKVSHTYFLLINIDVIFDHVACFGVASR